jgi:hypothetical protein
MKREKKSEYGDTEVREKRICGDLVLGSGGLV